jgi:hypothetical protein
VSVSRRTADPAGQARIRPLIESLEQRSPLTVDLWTGAAAAAVADFNWSNPANWSLLRVPGLADTASFTKNSQVKAFAALVDSLSPSPTS